MKRTLDIKLFREIVFLVCLIVAIILIARYSIKTKKEEERDRVSTILSTMLKIENQAINNWFEGRKLHIEDIANNDDIIAFSERLLEIKNPDQNSLVDLPIQKEVRSFFDSVLVKYSYLGIFIISPEYVSLSSMRDENIGTYNVIAKNESDRLAMAFEGQTVLITPFASEVLLEDNKKRATMFIATPVRNENNEVIAVFTFRVDPRYSLSTFTEMSWFGKTSNTYAFNDKGKLITQSRHEIEGSEKVEDIERLGVLLVDPNTNERIISVKTAIEERSTGINVNGYPNYKGVEVVGGWIWNETLGIGLTSEMSKEEAFSYYYSYRRSIIMTTSIIIVLLIFITSVMIINRHKKQILYQRLQEKMGVLENALSLFIANAPVGITRRSKDGKFLEVNDEFCRFTGYRSDELKRLSTWDLTPDFYKGQEEKQLKLLEETGRYGPYEKEYLHKHGHLINVLIGGVLVNAQDGEEEEVIWSVVLDITENKQNEKELIKSKNLAERASTTKSTFLANMSHEIRTPLNSILGHAQILQYSGELTDQGLKSSMSIMKSGEHLLALINDILDLSKIEAGRIVVNKSSFDFRQMLNDLYNLFNITAENKGVTLAIEFTPNFPKIIYGDEQRIRQVIINLLNNAIKFTDSGGVILTASIQEDKLLIEIKDTGAGIPEDKLESVFDTFEQAETGLKNKGGVGLGLSISRDLARVMGGDIIVTSNLGKGSIFTFTIDFIGGKSEDVDTAKEESRRVLKLKEQYMGLKVLVVDDIVQNLEVAEALLAPIGFQVETTEQGAGLEQRVREFLPDVMLLDLQISDVNMLEVIRNLRKIEAIKHIPVIALSASIMDEDKSKYIDAGVDAIVMKPYKVEEVLKNIQVFIGVRYYYEDIETEKKEVRIELATNLAMKLPGELIKKTVQAATIGDIEELENLNQRITEINNSLGEIVKNLIDDFEFDQLKKIFSNQL